MPEGPEVRRAADQIERAVMGAPLREVFFAFERLEEWGEHFLGDEGVRGETYGKALGIVLACGYAVYTHNQLFGMWQIRRAGVFPKTNRQLRFMVTTDAKSAQLYSASQIEVLHRDELAQHAYIAKLGPDPLRDDVSAATIREHLRKKRFARRQLGALLLDQGFVAGVGNYMRSEILFEAGLAPEHRLSELDDPRVERLAEVIYGLSHRAYRKRGFTLDDELAARLKREGADRRDRRHYVFARSRRRCYRCQSVIERIEFANRRLYRCAECQRSPNA